MSSSMISVLFVDEDKDCLGGLRARLRKQRKFWNMNFVESGKRAMEMLGEESVDVVVTESRMKGIDGLQLLSHVRENHPNALRIVLSGYVESEHAMRMSLCAHEFLAKPCQTTILSDLIGRRTQYGAVGADEVEDDETLNLDISSLPPVPDTYARLDACLSKEGTGLRDIAEVIESDVLVATQVLRIANSALFGDNNISDLHRALSVLGVDIVKSLVFSVATYSTFKSKANNSFGVRKHQSQALVTAKIARWIGLESGFKCDAYMAGLIHDIASLVRAFVDPNFDGRSSEDSNDHAKLGARLLTMWGLPFDIVESVAFHREPAELGRSELSLPGIVHIARSLGLEQTKGRSGSSELDEEYVEACGLSSMVEDCRRWMAGDKEETAA